jgi:hypothetical protein
MTYVFPQDVNVKLRAMTAQSVPYGVKHIALKTSKSSALEERIPMDVKKQMFALIDQSVMTIKYVMAIVQWNVIQKRNTPVLLPRSRDAHKRQPVSPIK